MYALGLACAHLLEESAHGTSVGEGALARLIHGVDGCACALRGGLVHAVVRAVYEALQYLEQLFGVVVLDIDEAVEAAAHAGVDAEQVFHLCAVACGDDHELATVVLHSFHKFLQRLRAEFVLGAVLPHGCECVGLVDEKYAAHGLVAEMVHDLWRLAGVGADHL